ncbi:protein of unknown function [Saccharopolyspora kobensis]|uniref:DUF397 domain-containing protein n=1 Tax=Saccharopolyspora kobensis TaxID=146035 RepID=A0A1H6DHD4_9PSEU|nr:DUF397 domain-containing protein [Saccharopolyspora kobensis]SEG84601.1 protein of unknown function [Saccharopolyspora kobensis]SFD27536.1 protein of unknown function [Saccharopolyspora kobensis]
MRPEPAWKKSSRSGQANACVEVASNVPGRALVRDSKLGGSSPTLNVTASAFADFVAAIKSGKLAD